MTPDHVRGRLSSDAGAISNSIISPIVPSLMPTLSNAPSLPLSPVLTTRDNLIHRPFPHGLLSTPQAAAGTRIEPPASLAWASGTTPAATAAAAPPEDPPALRSRFHGLRATGPMAGSLTRLRPS